ncbi:MAG: hypothetical protein MHM6MM_005035 [Cercozoa sp. M6MM]
MSSESLDETESGVAPQASERVLRFVLADGSIGTEVPGVALAPKELKNTSFEAQLAGDSSADKLNIARPEVTVEEVQNWARDRREKEKPVFLPTVVRVLNQQFFGERLRLFTPYGETEDWELSQLAAPIIDFHETLCSFGKRLDTCVNGLDMFTISVLLQFANRVQSLLPAGQRLEATRAKSFNSFFRSLKEFSAYCEKQTLYLLSAERDWQTSQGPKKLAGDNDVSKLALLTPVMRAKCHLPSLSVPTRSFATERGRKMIQYHQLQVLPTVPFGDRSEPVSSLCCDIGFTVLSVLPKDAVIKREIKLGAPCYRLNKKDFFELHVPCFEIRGEGQKPVLLSSSEAAARAGDYANGRMSFETLGLPCINPSSLRDGETRVLGFCAPPGRQPIQKWVPIDLLQRSFSAPANSSD